MEIPPPSSFLIQRLKGMLKRTQYCGTIIEDQTGQQVIVNGWVENIRDHGGVTFVDVRDRKGVVQAVFNPEISPESHSLSRKLRDEYVIAVRGQVRLRSEDTINLSIPTGTVEIVAAELEILNSSLTPPLAVSDRAQAGDMLRLKYRYLDLRRPAMQKNLVFRSNAAAIMREFLKGEDFVEIETPVLTKSTPEGARDFLVPSRLNLGEFYALPQSPQIFKQLLMIGGMERYYQIVKCFRDEDLRADRQPEFTQLDLELSFVDEDDVIDVIERLMARLFDRLLDMKLDIPLPRLTYDHVMNTYGSDAPDLRIPFKLVDLNEVLKTSDYRPFLTTIKDGGVIKGMNAKGGAELSKRELEDLIKLAISYGAQGLSWIKIRDTDWQSPLVKMLSEAEKDGMREALELEPGDLAVFVAGPRKMANEVLGRIRIDLAHRLQKIDKDSFVLCWVTEFPLLEIDPETSQHKAVHHPFTAPRDEDLPLLKSEPLKVKSRAYDLVMNGNEVGGGSIRIHRPEVQEQLLDLLGSGGESLREQFDFLLEALRLGAPPHGGIALGMDRLVMLMLKESTIREVMAFPKTQKAACPLTHAPAPVSNLQLHELGIRVSRKSS